jgi:hypothetical protein
MAQEDRGFFPDRGQEEREEGYKQSKLVLVPPTLLVR